MHVRAALRVSAFAGIWSLVAWAAEAPLPMSPPESVGMSAERLGRIDTWLNDLVARKQAAGFVSLVARRGRVVQHRAYGKRGLESAEPMPIDALFDLASMTKPITVAAALMLLEEGRFTLNDSIGDYLPEFAKPRVETRPGVVEPARRPIRVRDLFTHTSGVFSTRSRAEMFEFPSLGAHMRDLARQPLRYEPGSTFLYGTSHDVLGYLVESVSGMPLDRFVRERILTPLSMQDTYYWPPESTNARRAILVVNGKDDPASLSRVPPAAAKARTYIGGASGLYSTAADYWRFAQMLANGGEANGKRLLGPRTIAWMADNHIGDMASFTTPGTRFGLGLAVVTDPAASGLPYSKGTYYWSGSQGTIFWIDPAEELVGVLMVQLTPNSLKLRERFSALVYGAIVDAKSQAAEANHSPELQALYAADQADRQGNAIDWKIVGPRDAARRREVRALIEAGKARTGRDYYNAAMVFQHGEGPADILFAHVLAVTAVGLGEPRGRWLAAASLDRYLHRLKQPQIFGTQFQNADLRNKQGWTMDPLDRELVPARLRAANCVPDLTSHEAMLAALRRGDKDAAPARPPCDQ